MRWRRALAMVYGLLGGVLAVYAFVDPLWGFPSCLVLGGWLLFLASRCLGQGELTGLLRRTAGVYLLIAAAGVALLVWNRTQGRGPGETGRVPWVSFPVFLSTVSAVAALVSWLALRRGTADRGADPS